MTGVKTDSGYHLNEEWNVGARHALFHKEGTFYMLLERFPVALFDTNGYLLFQTEEEYLSCQYLEIDERVNVRGGISAVPGYVQVHK